MIDKDISISNLIYFMKTMLSEVFERDITVRLRPGFFPFVEPGFELDNLLPDLRRRGLPQLQELRLAGAVPLRDDFTPTC